MPTDPKPRKKRAIIISESRPLGQGDEGFVEGGNAVDNTFEQVFNTNKKGFEKFYPDGVENLNVYGADQLNAALAQAREQDADIIFQGHQGDYLAGIPSTGEFGDENNFVNSILKAQNEGFDGNCYLGTCYGEQTKKALNKAGVTIPTYSTPGDKQWFGPNLNNVSSDNFTDFFFGLNREGKKLSPEEVQSQKLRQFLGPQTGNISPQATQAPVGTVSRGRPGQQFSVNEIANQF